MDRGPRWKRLDPEARREQILEVAEEAFARRPPQEVSLTEIATAAGVSRALVAHYFGGRHGLELAVQRRVLGLGEDAIATDRGTSIVDTVQRYVSAWLDFAEGNQEVTLRLNVFAGAVPDRPSEALVDETRKRIIDTMLVNHFGHHRSLPRGAARVPRIYGVRAGRRSRFGSSTGGRPAPGFRPCSCARSWRSFATSLRRSRGSRDPAGRDSVQSPPDGRAVSSAPPTSHRLRQASCV